MIDGSKESRHKVNANLEGSSKVHMNHPSFILPLDSRCSRRHGQKAVAVLGGSYSEADF